MRQHRWMSNWDESGSVEGAAMKVCEDCGAELIATWEVSNKGKPSERRRVATLVYVDPCEGKRPARRA